MGEIERHIRSVQYPADKETIVEAATASEISDIDLIKLTGLPEQTYDSAEHVSKVLDS